MLILDAAALERRRTAARGPLAPLLASLADDLANVMDRPLFIPPEKAKLTRIGGRCPVDGTALTFDPFSPHEHACPLCHARFREAEHHRWWIMFYQLWLAERVVHAATLFAVTGHDNYRVFAEEVLGRYAEGYDSYPNNDNVLGPSRLFFSTYLESIWLLQLCVAIDLLEASGAKGRVGEVLRDRVVAPASAIVAGYNEGDSNRQVWNNAALFAGARLLGNESDCDAILHRRYGIVDHLTRSLLPDGTWYEGENYHQFAHRGLWYGVQMAKAASFDLPASLEARFQSAYTVPFLTALPDFTFPARRDSPHRVSLRQWRYAESCELGLVHADDERLIGALHTLYDGQTPRRDTGRWRSAAESERNEPASSLTRADLGWRSLLCARPDLPPLEEAAASSVLLESQGLAIFRRDHGRVYAALDYGHSGGGHGHPDRLNVLLADGDRRWLDDPGTGSYVDPSLHWYRSSLAHNVPMFSGQTQKRVAGTLVAHEDRGAAGWVRATVNELAPRSRATRTLVAMPDYVVDVLEWQATADAWLDLPLHFDGVAGHTTWTSIDVAQLALSDGAAFTHSAERADEVESPIVIRDATRSTPAAWIITRAPVELFRLLAPGAPGEAPTPFLMVRSRSDRGSMTIVWNVRGSIESCTASKDGSVMSLTDGSKHVHAKSPDGWHIDLHAGSAKSSIDLGGVRAVPVQPTTERRGSVTPPRGAPLASPIPLSSARMTTFELGESHYRASERPWSEADAPTARVGVSHYGSELLLEIEVRKQNPVFAPVREWNPLDNERADINSDGAQLFVRLPATSSAPEVTCGWLMVPEADNRVRISATTGAEAGMTLRATWSAVADSYVIRCSVDAGSRLREPGAQVLLEVMVNDISSDRERRRGQLLLSGGNGEFVYLQGDRHSGRWTSIRIQHD